MARFTVLSLVLVSLLFTPHRALAAPIRACDFMTVQTASSVFGAAVSAGREEGLDMGAQRCVFDQINSTSPGKISLTISDANTMATALSEAVTSETIPSLGEWNSCMCSGSTENTLAVIYRGKVLFLVSSGSQNPHLKAALIRAMRQTMQKL